MWAEMETRYCNVDRCCHISRNTFFKPKLLRFDNIYVMNLYLLHVRLINALFDCLLSFNLFYFIGPIGNLYSVCHVSHQYSMISLVPI